MFDTFIPLVPTAETGRSTFLASHSSTPAGPPEPDPCSKPIVTLQRNGEIVSAIRIQCGCGQVVDLSCVY